MIVIAGLVYAVAPKKCHKKCQNPSRLRGIGKQKTLSSGVAKRFPLQVVPPGIEPGTQGFSVLGSTNWAMAPLLLFCECKGSANFWIHQIFAQKNFTFLNFPHFLGFLPPESRFLVLSTNKKYSCSELFSEIICNFTIRFCAFAHADACKPEFF